MSDAENDRKQRIFAELTDALYRQSATAIVGVSASIVVFAVFQWNRQPSRALIPWLALHFAALAVRSLLARAYFRRARAGLRDSTAWARRFTAALSFSGLLWGVAGALFFDASDALGTAFLLIYDGGVVATCLITVSSYLPAFMSFTVLAVAPLMVSCWLADSPVHRFIALVALLYIAICTVASRRLHLIMLRSAELRFQNEDLAASLKREKERVEAALLGKSKFLAAASHDLRQPLHALNLFVELLDPRVGGAEERGFMARIRSSARALEGLLNSLLDISRIDSHTLKQHRTHFHLAPLFRQLEHEFAAVAQRKGLALHAWEPGLVLQSDWELLGRVLRNLVSNAVRYTTQGSVTLEARRGPGDAVTISVSDTGPGIPPGEQESVFEEFYQIGNLERDREKGLGLGLSIVRGLCQVLGHPVRLVSQPARAAGTEFLVEVPAGQAALARASETTGETLAPRSSLAGRRVLVIDDERDIRAGMAALLETWGCEAICAASAEEALGLMAEARRSPDAVICDYRLPENMTGTAALARLQERFGTHLPAIIVTGDTSPERIREMKESGRPFLFKPVVPGKLRAALTALVTESVAARRDCTLHMGEEVSRRGQTGEGGSPER